MMAITSLNKTAIVKPTILKGNKISHPTIPIINNPSAIGHDTKNKIPQTRINNKAFMMSNEF